MDSISNYYNGAVTKVCFEPDKAKAKAKAKVKSVGSELKKKDMKKKSIPKALRMKLWEQQFGDTLHGSCFSCHRNVKIDDFQAGHIIAEANGGKTTLSNLKVLCKPCNTSCGTMNLSSFKESLEAVENPRSMISLKPPIIDKISNRVTQLRFETPSSNSLPNNIQQTNGGNVALAGARNYGEVFIKF
jgi:hypothetical protein